MYPRSFGTQFELWIIGLSAILPVASNSWGLDSIGVPSLFGVPAERSWNSLNHNRREGRPPDNNHSCDIPVRGLANCDLHLGPGGIEVVAWKAAILFLGSGGIESMYQMQRTQHSIDAAHSSQVWHTPARCGTCAHAALDAGLGEVGGEKARPRIYPPPAVVANGSTPSFFPWCTVDPTQTLEAAAALNCHTKFKSHHNSEDRHRGASREHMRGELYARVFRQDAGSGAPFGPFRCTVCVHLRRAGALPREGGRFTPGGADTCVPTLRTVVPPRAHAANKCVASRPVSAHWWKFSDTVVVGGCIAAESENSESESNLEEEHLTGPPLIADDDDVDDLDPDLDEELLTQHNLTAGELLEGELVSEEMQHRSTLLPIKIRVIIPMHGAQAKFFPNLERSSSTILGISIQCYKISLHMSLATAA
ncbi:hypothetical protein B0H10DRAFT_1966235 [Mycena sp. CBHHK59/15]|nr:hypothetical protein B0H10DRAFT_1966235 [Mycena sp. CBHHK59/15]